MQTWLADPLFGGPVQSGRHLIELLAAFGLTAIIGLERTIQGKVAGLRTQTIVGTSSALILLVSKYGFGDVLTAQSIVVDPQLNARLRGTVCLHIIYDNGRGVLLTILQYQRR